MSDLERQKKPRFTEIDFLRFLAAFSVMFFHYTIRGYADGDELSPVKFPMLSIFSRYGYFGVDLFFMISGFVILMTAIDRSAKSFVISRIVRLYPAYWVCCTATFLITSFLGTDVLKVSFSRYVANMTMLHGFFPIGHVDGVYWTLFVEMKFYILVFILILTKQVRNIQYFLGGWLLISLISLNWQSSFVEYILITKQSSYFIAGAIFYLIWREGASPYKAVVLLGCYLVSLCNSMHLMTTKINWYHIPFSVLTMVLIISVFYALFLMIAYNKANWLRHDYFIFLGALTYPVYLLHSRIGFVALNAGHMHVNKYVLLIAVMFAICWLAYLVHVKVEAQYSLSLKKYSERLFSFMLNKISGTKQKY